MNKTYIIGIVLLIVVGGGAFFGGMKYQQSRRPVFTGNRPANENRNVNGMIGAGRLVAGEIISRDDKTITVKMNNGSSKIVILSDKTEVNKAEMASQDELKVGVTVSVFGTSNSDGSVTAQNIQLNPVQRDGVTATPTPM